MRWLLNFLPQSRLPAQKNIQISQLSRYLNSENHEWFLIYVVIRATSAISMPKWLLQLVGHENQAIARCSTVFLSF